MPAQSSSGPSDFLAAERTFLAWIRTGLALMGFGFVVARFGLFLEALLGSRTGFAEQSYGLSFWVGTVLIVAGVIINLAGARTHVRLVGQLKRGEFAAGPSRLAIALALLLAALGLALAGYLLSVRAPSTRVRTTTMNPASPQTASSLMSTDVPCVKASDQLPAIYN